MVSVCQSAVRKRWFVCFSKTHHLLRFPLLAHKVSWDEGAPFCSIVAACRVTKLAQFGIFPLLALNRQSVPTKQDGKSISSGDCYVLHGVLR